MSLTAFVRAARKGRLRKAKGCPPKCVIGTFKTPLSLGLSSGYSIEDICTFYTTRRWVPGCVQPFEDAYQEFYRDLAFEDSISEYLVKERCDNMDVDDIISYDQLVIEENSHLQKGMNFGVGKNYSVLLMSLRQNAPYEDVMDERTGTLIYEGHDQPQTEACPDPKLVDQPMTTPSGAWTENGKFFRATVDLKSGLLEEPELVKVYEKISKGVWCYKGFFELIDGQIVSDGRRRVFKFRLKPVTKVPFGRPKELPHLRLIPSGVKVEVWRRDGGKCVICGSQKNLHYDHEIPFSKGGSGMTADNVRLLCAKHNLEKSDKIISLMPWIYLGGKAAVVFRSGH